MTFDAATSSMSASGERTAGAETSLSWFTLARTTLAALIALAASIVSLLFTIAPALKPDPRDRVGADVSIFAVERNVTIGQWISRAFPQSDGDELRKRYPDRAALGELLYVRTSVDGHKHRNVALRVSVLDAKSERRVPPQEIDAPPIAPVALSAPSERSVQAIWLPDLSHEPTGLFLRVELWDRHGILAISDSPRLRRGRFVAAPTPGG